MGRTISGIGLTLFAGAASVYLAGVAIATDNRRDSMIESGANMPRGSAESLLTAELSDEEFELEYAK